MLGSRFVLGHKCSCSLAFLVLLKVSVVHELAFAATIITGTVSDQVTGLGIDGVNVRLNRAGASLGEAVTANGGRFTSAIDLGASPGVDKITLHVDDPQYERHAIEVTVIQGRPDRPNYELSLLPRGLGPCVSQRQHAVVVGNFGQADLTDAITWVLLYGLETNLQKVKSLKDFRPRILSCHDAKPRSPTDGGRYAKALGADVLLGGRVEPKPGTQRHDVTMYVSDQFNLFVPPRAIVNPNVDLMQREGEQLDPKTHALILIAMARGLELDGQYAKCLDVLGVAERMLPRPSDDTVVIRRACEARVVNRGLSRGG